MEEITYLDAKGAIVTSTRITIGGKTYATRNVGSVGITERPKPRWPFWFVLLGLLILVGSLGSRSGGAGFIGFVISAMGAVGYFTPRKLALTLMAGAGEVVALESTDKAGIQALHDAIVQAISGR